MNTEDLLHKAVSETDPHKAAVYSDLYKARIDAEKGKSEHWTKRIRALITATAVTLISSLLLSHCEHRGELEAQQQQAAHELLRGAINSSGANSLDNLFFILDAGLIPEEVYKNDDIRAAARKYRPRRFNQDGSSNQDLIGVFFASTKSDNSKTDSEAISSFESEWSRRYGALKDTERGFQVIEIVKNKQRYLAAFALTDSRTDAEIFRERLNGIENLGEDELAYIKELAKVCGDQRATLDKNKGLYTCGTPVDVPTSASTD